MKNLLFILLMPCLVQAQFTTPISIENSGLTWEGRPLIGGGHTGTLQFVSGTLTTDSDGKMVKGEFVIDMQSIKNTDIDDKQGAKDLEDHLKSDDFFSAEKFPKATFVMVAVTKAFIFPQEANQYNVSGLLTIKGITHPVNFLATIPNEKGELTAKVTIDRTKWGINYQSKSIFGTLKDGIISDDITITIRLKMDGC